MDTANAWTLPALGYRQSLHVTRMAEECTFVHHCVHLLVTGIQSSSNCGGQHAVTMTPQGQAGLHLPARAIISFREAFRWVVNHQFPRAGMAAAAHREQLLQGTLNYGRQLTQCTLRPTTILAAGQAHGLVGKHVISQACMMGG